MFALVAEPKPQSKGKGKGRKGKGKKPQAKFVSEAKGEPTKKDRAVKVKNGTDHAHAYMYIDTCVVYCTCVALGSRMSLYCTHMCNSSYMCLYRCRFRGEKNNKRPSHSTAEGSNADIATPGTTPTNSSTANISTANISTASSSPTY